MCRIIPRLHDFSFKDKTFSILLDYASKGDLKRYFLKRGKLEEGEAVHILFQLLHALDYIHARDVIHRDIKLENILVADDLTVKLCDFGWASPPDDFNRNVVCGTYEYMAPETITCQHYNSKIDIWSFGVLAYELVHGRTPFSDRTVEGIKQKILEGNFSINSSTSEQYKRLIFMCLEYLPDRRPTARDIIGYPIFALVKSVYYPRMPTQQKSEGSTENSPSKSLGNDSGNVTVD